MNVSSLTGMFRSPALQQKNPLSQGKAQTNPASNVLTKLSEKMIVNDEKKAKLETSFIAQHAQKDIYTSEIETILEDAADEYKEMLETMLALGSMFARGNKMFENELTNFRNTIAELDQTIAGYQDILDGKAEPPKDVTRDEVKLMLESAQKTRNDFVHERVTELNERIAEMQESNTEKGLFNLAFGYLPYGAMDRSNWTIDGTASDIISELNRVIGEVHELSEVYGESLQVVQKLLDNFDKESFMEELKRQLAELYKMNPDAAITMKELLAESVKKVSEDSVAQERSQESINGTASKEKDKNEIAGEAKAAQEE